MKITRDVRASFHQSVRQQFQQGRNPMHEGPLSSGDYERLLRRAEERAAAIRNKTIEECALVAEIALAKTAASDIRRLKS